MAVRFYRKKGIALFRYGEKEGGADAIFGEPTDSILLGALTLEALGLVLDPLKRDLKPLPMILAGWRRPDSVCLRDSSVRSAGFEVPGRQPHTARTTIFSAVCLELH